MTLESHLTWKYPHIITLENVYKIGHNSKARIRPTFPEKSEVDNFCVWYFGHGKTEEMYQSIQSERHLDLCRALHSAHGGRVVQICQQSNHQRHKNPVLKRRNQETSLFHHLSSTRYYLRYCELTLWYKWVFSVVTPRWLIIKSKWKYVVSLRIDIPMTVIFSKSIFQAL